MIIIVKSAIEKSFFPILDPIVTIVMISTISKNPTVIILIKKKSMQLSFVAVLTDQLSFVAVPTNFVQVKSLCSPTIKGILRIQEE